MARAWYLIKEAIFWLMLLGCFAGIAACVYIIVHNLFWGPV